MKIVAYIALGLWAFGCFTLAAYVHDAIGPTADSIVQAVAHAAKGSIK